MRTAWRKQMKLELIRDIDDGVWSGHAQLYKVEPPVNGIYGREMNALEGIENVEYIVVSALDLTMLGTDVVQTFIFAATEDGFPRSMLHLEGSVHGEVNHEKAVEGFIAAHQVH
jgi:hypothetical protein